MVIKTYLDGLISSGLTGNRTCHITALQNNRFSDRFNRYRNCQNRLFVGSLRPKNHLPSPIFSDSYDLHGGEGKLEMIDLSAKLNKNEVEGICEEEIKLDKQKEKNCE
jgi:hypothetical protein